MRHAANATIQAENERKQREYEEKLRKAREKAARQAKAQADYEKALEEYNRNKDKTDKENAKRLAEYKRAMTKYKKELKNAKQRGEKLDRLPQRQVLHGGQPLPKGLSLSADLHQYEGATSTPKPLKPLPKGKGKGKGKGRGGLLSTDMYEYESGTGHQPTATSHQGLNNRPVAPKTNYAANQTAVQNRKKAKEAVVGKPTKPILAITDTPIPVAPHIEKDLAAKVEAVKPEEIPQLKTDYINSAVEHERLVGELYNEMKSDMNRIGLMQEFDHWVGVAQNTTLSPAERKQAAMYASRAAEEYNLQDNGKAHKERVATLMQMVNDSHDQLVQQQFLLQQLGVRMSEDEIGFDTNWLRSGNQLYGADNALVQQAQTFTTGKKEDTAELRQHLYAIDKHNRHRGWGLDSWEIPPEEAQWLEANGYGWINTTPELRSIEMSGDNAIPFSGNVEAYYQQINAKSHSYQRERNATTKLMAFSRMEESEQKNAIAAGEQKTGLAEILAGTSLEEARTASMASLQGGRRAGSLADLASQIAKNLGLPKDYVTAATVEQLLQDEGSLAFIDYCYGIGDEQTAKDYLYNYTEVANRAQGEKIADLVSFNDAGKNASKFEKDALEVIRTVVEFMAQFGYGATGNFAKGVKRIFTNEDVPVSVGEAFSRDVTKNKIERGWNPFWAQAVDSAAVSAGNNAASMLLGKGIGMVGSAVGGAVGGTIGTGIAKAASHAGSVLMGASAMGHAKQEALREGYGNKAATMYGILDGVSETILQEKVGGLVGLGDHGVFTKALGGLVNKIPSAMGRWGVNMVLDGLSEVGQELFGNVFENINRTVTLGEEHGLFDNFKDEAGQTVVSTLL
ncbi:MAG: hypothetical protein II410_07385, partial [Ruminococcus sp.]|nr:hypothetical protein [Ruminococcus sp.]